MDYGSSVQPRMVVVISEDHGSSGCLMWSMGRFGLRV